VLPVRLFSLCELVALVELAAEKPRGVRREAAPHRIARKGGRKAPGWNALHRDWLETYSGKQRIARGSDLPTSESYKRELGIRARKATFYCPDIVRSGQNAIGRTFPDAIQRRDFYGGSRRARMFPAKFSSSSAANGSGWRATLFKVTFAVNRRRRVVAKRVSSDGANAPQGSQSRGEAEVPL